jgi:hypothetical protein
MYLLPDLENLVGEKRRERLHLNIFQWELIHWTTRQILKCNSLICCIDYNHPKFTAKGTSGELPGHSKMYK